MIDSRIPALAAGGASLVFGGWAALGGVPELGIAAGVLGLLAGVLSLAPRSAHQAEPAGGSPQGGAGTRPGVTDRRDDPQVDTGAGRLDAPTGDPAPPTIADLRTGSQTPSDAQTARGAGEVPDTNLPETKVPGEGPSATQSSASSALTDPATGLFSENYLLVALESRLASARRHLRPVAVALVDVTAGLPGENTRPADPKVVAEAIRDTVRDSDIACRLEDGTFGVILEDTPENGAVWTVERIRRNLVSTSGHHTLWAGVACYPAHAFDGGEMMEQVRFALAAAREWNQDRIEVAVAE